MYTLPVGSQNAQDRATIVYTNRIHSLYPDVPIVLGGIEASLRRFAHYDYWQNRYASPFLPMHRQLFLPMVWLKGRW